MQAITRSADPAMTEPLPPARPRWATSRESALDDAAFSAFYRAHAAGVIRTVALIVRDRARAEDITQDAFLELVRNWAKVSDYEQPDAWVRRVAIRLAMRGIRRDALWTSVRHLLVPRQTMEAHDLGVADAIARLPRMQRAAVVLHYYEGRPASEIAQILGCGEPTARVHLFRARRRLAEMLGEGDDAARP